MIKVHKSVNITLFTALVTKIRSQIEEWKAVSVTIENAEPHGNVMHVTHQLEEFFGACEGELFVCGPKELIALIRLGAKAELTEVKAGIVRALPSYKCRIETGAVSREGLKTIEIKLEAVAGQKPTFSAESVLLEQRRARKERIIFVVDDDMFMRSLVVKTAKAHGTVVEFADSKDVVESYLKTLPDIVFLDIHLPSGSGLDVLNAIQAYDADACIVMLSADSVKDNVIASKTKGAAGFVAKPFTKDKIEEALKKCPTF